ncbi:NADPH-dependent FMN reductase [Flavobacterium sp. JP2137]|uniref:NADPH-dependent FMN reductase n=1 Tax=Flavobacterium sp. JP2137 TaxID=3414510 RepID=UPI003D2FDFB5
MKNYKVAVLVGSLRKESYNLKLAKSLILLAPKSLELELIPIGALPFYNEDAEATPPESWTAFRKQLSQADAVLFLTPEYNRSVPAVLKNAIDVGSRPYGKSVWSGKPGGVISASIGGISGFGANHHLRQSLVFVNVPTMAQPEAYIGGVAELFDAKGKLINESTQGFLSKWLLAFEKWVATNAVA